MLIPLLAGFGYTFFNEKIRRSGLPEGYDEFSGLMHDIEMPLLFEPGTSWEYGVSYMSISLPNNSLPFAVHTTFCCAYNFLLSAALLQVNIDWAGVMVERVTNMSLNDYMKQHIFAPLGIKNISMFPTSEMKSHLAYARTRPTHRQTNCPRALAPASTRGSQRRGE